MPKSGQWDDLGTRVASAAVLIVVGGAALWAGGTALKALTVLVSGLMIWELTRMLAPDALHRARLNGLLAGLMMTGAFLAGGLPVWLLFLGAPAVLVLGAKKLPLAGAAYAFGLQLAVWHIAHIRQTEGLDALLWLVLVVVASDVMGYFAGRLLGGPKFWPAVSPKKTWSGTIAGWVGAGLVGYGFVLWADAAPVIIALSVVTAFAAQFGDIAESALKRATGVKDSSQLIPGHGGVLDRFDGLAGAALLLLFVSLVAGGGGL